MFVVEASFPFYGCCYWKTVFFAKFAKKNVFNWSNKVSNAVCLMTAKQVMLSFADSQELLIAEGNPYLVTSLIRQLIAVVGSEYWPSPFLLCINLKK